MISYVCFVSCYRIFIEIISPNKLETSPLETKIKPAGTAKKRHNPRYFSHFYLLHIRNRAP